MRCRTLYSQRTTGDRKRGVNTLGFLLLTPAEAVVASCGSLLSSRLAAYGVSYETGKLYTFTKMGFVLGIRKQRKLLNISRL